MSKSELCGHIIRAYLFYARSLQQHNEPYGWILEQIRDVNRLRQFYKELEYGETVEFLFKGAA